MQKIRKKCKIDPLYRTVGEVLYLNLVPEWEGVTARDHGQVVERTEQPGHSKADPLHVGRAAVQIVHVLP